MSGGVPTGGGTERARRPNLLFLITDQQRADTVRAGGPCLTPHLQALAAEGARFERCYAPNPICSPTRASLLTGLLPHAHGVTDVTHAVPPTQADLAHGVELWTSRLKAAGYRVGYFGKWHVERSDELERFGIDEYEVDLRLTGVASHDGPLDPRVAVEQPGYRPFLLAGVTDDDPSASREAYLVDRGIDYLRRAEASGEPWALFVSTEAPHDPYVVPRELYERYDPAALELPASFGDPLADRPAVYRRIAEAWQGLSETQVRQAIACYYAACSLVDDQFGRLLAALDEAGGKADTYVVFTSDHGDYLGAHGLFLKGVAQFEEAYKVPLVVRGPGVAPGTVVTEPVSLLDVGRTLMRLLLGEDWGGHGRDLSPLVRGGPDVGAAVGAPGASAGAAGPGGDASPAGRADDAQAYAEFHGQRLRYTQRIVWRGDHKYVFNGFDDDELYDLATDPHELENLARRPEARELKRSMAAAMWRVARDTGDDTLFGAEYGMFRFAPVGPGAADGWEEVDDDERQ